MKYTLDSDSFPSRIIGGFSVVLRVMGAAKWTMIPILAVAIGDGLAEPVAVFWEDRKWFGRNSQVSTFASLLGDRSSLPSIEGSGTVFVGTLVSVLIYLKTMSDGQLIFFVCVLPIVITILEMVAPAFLGQSVFTVLRLFDDLLRGAGYDATTRTAA